MRIDQLLETTYFYLFAVFVILTIVLVGYWVLTYYYPWTQGIPQDVQLKALAPEDQRALRETDEEDGNRKRELFFFYTDSGSFNQNLVEKIFYYSSHVSMALQTLVLVLIFVNLVVFDLIHPAVGTLITVGLSWMTFCFFSPPSILSVRRKTSSSHSLLRDLIHYKIHHHRALFFGGLFLIFLGCFTFNFFFDGSCAASEPNNFSTHFSRFFLPNPCEKGKPCHLYLTLPKSSTTGMIINFHSSTNPSHQPTWAFYDTLRHPNVSSFDQLQSLYQNNAIGNHAVVKHSDDKRYVHWVELANLTPNTTYFFRVGYGTDINNYSEERKFRTAPIEGKIKFVVGGNMGLLSSSAKILHQAVLEDPLFIAFGGDVAYDNGFRACYRQWDTWFNIWEEQTSLRDTYDNVKRMIPMLIAIGSHETKGSYAASMGSIPFYFNYFLQQSPATRPQNRSSFHAHVIGQSTIILSLDSGHKASPESQVKWMATNLADPSYKHKFALYNVPMYPVTTSFNDSHSLQLRKSWTNIFDSSEIELAFEHHERLFKATCPIQNTLIAGKYRRYIGGGCFGVEPAKSFNKELKYIDKVDLVQNYLLVTIDRENVTVLAKNAQGEQIYPLL